MFRCSAIAACSMKRVSSISRDLRHISTDLCQSGNLESLRRCDLKKLLMSLKLAAFQSDQTEF